MRYFITLLLLTVSVSALASNYVYKRTNPDGTVEFSDKPLEGGNVMKIPKGSTFTMPSTKPKETSSIEEEKEPEKVNYELAIVQPKDDQAIRSNEGNVTFRATLTPSQLSTNHRIVWSIDGQEVPQFNGLLAKMKNVDRGTHQVQVKIIDKEGNSIAASETVSFHLLRVAGG